MCPGAENTLEFVPKIEVLADDGQADAIADALSAGFHTGKICDGTIWIVDVPRGAAHPHG